MSENETAVKPAPKAGGSAFGMIKLGLILALYATVSCAILAVVNYFTSPRIAQNQLIRANEAMQVVFGGAEFEKADDFATQVNGSIELSELYLAREGGTVAGAVIQVEGPTYESAKIIVGLRLDGTVTGMQFLENHDSPGFGLKASDATFKLSNGKTFYDQFTGLNAASGFVLGETYDAISGATITSTSVGNLVKVGCDAILAYLESHGF